MLRKVDLHERANMFILAAALTMGLLPIVVPGLYSRFPPTAQLVLGNGLAIGATGVIAGLAIALAGARAIGTQLYGITATDPLTLAGVAILLLGTILLACVVPARKACAIAPRDALN